jgi:hypothetical protein
MMLQWCAVEWCCSHVQSIDVAVMCSGVNWIRRFARTAHIVDTKWEMMFNINSGNITNKIHIKIGLRLIKLLPPKIGSMQIWKCTKKYEIFAIYNLEKWLYLLKQLFHNITLKNTRHNWNLAVKCFVLLLVFGMSLARISTILIKRLHGFPGFF